MRYLLELNPSEDRSKLELVDAQIILARAEMDSGNSGVAKAWCKEARAYFQDRSKEGRDPNEERVYFDTLLLSGLLTIEPGGDAGAQILPLLELIRGREDDLRKRPIDINVR